jgi:hypothetical protein
MNAHLSDEDGRWPVVATVEVEASQQTLDALIHRATHYLFVPAVQSPRGYQWFDIRVDASFGGARAARIAYSLLVSLQCFADEGLLPGYRVVVGHEYLEISDAAAELLVSDFKIERAAAKVSS